MHFIKIYLVSLAIFFAIDLVWLGLIAKNLYKEQIGHLMAQEIKWSAALIFYFLYLFGLMFFAIWPALKDNNWSQALFYGSLFGLISYATYDLTNLATLTRWPIKIVIYDLIWGCFLSGTVSLLTFWIAKNWVKS